MGPGKVKESRGEARHRRQEVQGTGNESPKGVTLVAIGLASPEGSKAGEPKEEPKPV